MAMPVNRLVTNVRQVGKVFGQGCEQRVTIEFTDPTRGNRRYRRTFERPGGNRGGQLLVVGRTGGFIEGILFRAGYELASKILNEQAGHSSDVVTAISSARSDKRHIGESGQDRATAVFNKD
jgi:hypothetical protein